MQPISQLLGIKPNPRAPNSAKAEMIEKVMEFMKEPPKPSQARGAGQTTYGKRFKYWLGRTRDLTPDQIYQMLKKAETGKNPQALFNWLLKKHGEKNHNRSHGLA